MVVGQREGKEATRRKALDMSGRKPVHDECVGYVMRKNIRNENKNIRRLGHWAAPERRIRRGTTIPEAGRDRDVATGADL